MQIAVTWMLMVVAVMPGLLAEKYNKHSNRDERVSSNDSGDISPEMLGLRPSIPDEVLTLEESPNKIYDPRPQDLNSTLLRHKMRKNFDGNFMSIHRPLYLHNNSYSFPFYKNRRGKLERSNTEELPDWLRKLRFRYIWLPDGSKAQTSFMGSRSKRKLQNYLWAHTSCPILFKWRDLGPRFWPRWVKEGHCPPGKESCSIPPGMTCRSAESVYKTLLRWHCRNFELNMHCHWIKVQIPFITKCTCACPRARSGYQ